MEKKSKSQKRVERQKRREERRLLRSNVPNSTDQNQQQTSTKKKSLPGFLAKYKKELATWLQHYMTLFCKAEDEQISYFKEMSREQRNKAIQEYVDISEFKSMLETYLKEEELKRESKE